ncbi:hypothetical protein Btru_073955, partial [Bulinus truncatus]
IAPYKKLKNVNADCGVSPAFCDAAEDDRLSNAMIEALSMFPVQYVETAFGDDCLLNSFFFERELSRKNLQTEVQKCHLFLLEVVMFLGSHGTGLNPASVTKDTEPRGTGMDGAV